jgi:sulfatase maturation enzyme AslB (radical SAM superfamily)
MNCIFPFKGIFIESTMDVKFCCAGKYYFGNLKNSSLEDILLGEDASSVRDHIRNNRVHEYCTPCHGIENLGGNSQRTPIEEHIKPIIFTETSYQPDRIDIRWSNTCNLACNYCLPHFSSRWADVLSINIKSPSDEIYEKIFEFIEKYKNSIHNILMLGGEPLLLKQNNRLLDILPNKNYGIITNLSNPISKNLIAKKLLAEKNVSWGISFENVGKRFEYVRDGAKWNLFFENLRTLKNNKKHLHFYPLYCIYSAFNLVEYYELVDEFDINKITWQLLVADPMRVDTLSQRLKDHAIKEIDIISTRFNGYPGVSELEKIKDNLITSSNKDNTNKRFLDWTHNLENNQFSKNDLFKNLWPSLYGMLNQDV